MTRICVHFWFKLTNISASQKTTGSLLCAVISLIFAPIMSLLSATWRRSILNPHNSKVLDKILVSCPWSISTVLTVIPAVSTDHDSVICSLQIPKKGKKVFYFRDQRESCRQICYKLLRDANYNCVYRSMDPNEALCQLNSIVYSAFHIYCPTRQVTVPNRYPIYVTLAVKLLIKQRNKQLRKQNAAKAKDLNELIQKLVRKNCRILDKVGSRNWWTHINSLSDDKQPASTANVDVNYLNRYFNSFSNDPNG